MSQSLANLLVHLVFSTKNRVPMILPEVESELHTYIAGICHKNGAPILEIGGVDDHIHLLLVLPRTLSLAKLVEELKKGSSKWLNTKGRRFSEFMWQKGYGAFSVSPSHKEAVRRYIGNQREHHREVTFQEEFRRVLVKNGIQCDERFVWE